ncbi:MAG: hypothetical protein PHE88_09695 [Elusimicrobia bacterium]|nr:hypothetical protein [Elusimicrobiota bacterium]
MSKKIKFLVLFLALIIYRLGYVSAESFEKTALGQEVINLGLKFLDNPGDFFFNIHANSEDFSPVLSDKNGAIRFNLFPALFPFTWANLNVKAKLFNEQKVLPQIDIVGQYGDMIALRFISGDVKPSFNDYSTGLVFSKSATDETKLYGGVKYSSVGMDVKLSSSSAIEFGDFRVSELNFKVADIFVFTGLVHQKDINVPSLLAVQMGYGFKYKKIISRIMVSKTHLDLGMDIYPEGLFVIHPFIAYHWNF